MGTRILSVLGTRPEVIKMAPVLRELRSRAGLDPRVCLTGQHVEMIDPFLQPFGITADRNLTLMTHDQSLSDLTAETLLRMREVMDQERPDLVLVHGDTTSAMAAALSAFYLKIPVGHVEAGLRTQRLDSPFPEEANRRIIDGLSEFCFAPTPRARQNLLDEAIPEHRITVTGNTVIDALQWILNEETQPASAPLAYPVREGRRVILVTGHRRESFGEGLRHVCEALREIVYRDPNVEVVYPVHLNPNVHLPVHALLDGAERIHLLDPVDYVTFVHLMNCAYLILTDSGGIQEEAPALSKPVLVFRQVTERPELIESGAGRLVGTDAERIVEETRKLLNDPQEYAKMANAPNPFGDGRAAERIADRILHWAGGERGSSS